MGTKKFSTRSFSRGLSAPASKLIAIGGGKGGIGKSFISSHLSLFLANMGRRTVVIDLDLGASNVHTSLGISRPKKTLTDFIKDSTINLKDVVQPTDYPNLGIIGGCNNEFDLANLDLSRRTRLMSAIYNLDADFVVLDLSAGTHQATIDFFLTARDHFIVFTPDPSSIENAYQFMKSAFYRRIKRLEVQLNLHDEITELMDVNSKNHSRTPKQLLDNLKLINPDRGNQLVQHMESLSFNLLLNQVRTGQDLSVGKSVQTISQKYFGVPIQLASHISYDNAVWQSLRKRHSILNGGGHSLVYPDLLKLAKYVAFPNYRKAMV